MEVSEIDGNSPLIQKNSQKTVYMGSMQLPVHTFEFSIKFIHKAKTELSGTISKFVLPDKNYPASLP